MVLLGAASALLAGVGVGAWAANGAEVSGAALVSALACALAIPLGLLPATALGQARLAGFPVTVTLVPRGDLSVSWAKDVAPRVVATRDIRSVRAVAAPTPRVVLDVARDGGVLREHTIRLRTEAHARWLADQIEAARVHDAERDGVPDDVPGDLAALRQRPKVPEEP